MSGMCDGNNSDTTTSGLGQAEQPCSCCELNCVQVCFAKSQAGKYPVPPVACVWGLGKEFLLCISNILL